VQLSAANSIGFSNGKKRKRKNVLIAFPRRKMERKEREGAKL
jgi:hypothetical protein